VEKKTSRTNYAHRAWDLPDSAGTPEACYRRRKEFLRVFGLGLAASALLPTGIRAESRLMKLLLKKSVRSSLAMSAFGAIATPP
jgi:hypothetical protein